MQEIARKESTLERVGLGLAIVVLVVCAIALCAKLFSGFTAGGLMEATLTAEAEKGDPKAQFALGEAYLNGSFGVPKDREQAKLWLQKAQAQHYAPASCALGELHFAHDDGSVDDADAMQWLQEGARAGLANCMNTAAWYKATWANAAIRDPQGAETLAREALDRQPNVPGYMDTLAAAYAAEGRYDDAALEQQQAIAKLRALPGDQTGGINDMQSRLDLYQAGKPYVQDAAAPSAATSIQPQQPAQGGGQP